MVLVLPYDVARCLGDNRPECNRCGRKASGDAGYQVFIMPPERTDKDCEFLIEKNEAKND